MIKYKEFYDSIINPLEDDNIIKLLIKIYAERKNIYSSLVKQNSYMKQYKGLYDQRLRDSLYEKLFNIWKINVLSLTHDDIKQLIENNEVKKDFYQLQSYLKTLPNIKTEQEFINLLASKNSLISKYGWQTFGQNSGFVHINSKYLNRKQESIKVRHRLYLNTECVYTEFIVSLFIDECMNRNLPFYLKYDEYASRDDTIVIYSDTKNLCDYVEILRKLQKIYPNIFSKFYKPPILTGLIDGYIGYGSEPDLLPDGSFTSFNLVRSEAISKGILKALNEWVYINQNEIVIYDKQMLLKDYVAIKITDLIYKKNEKTFNDIYQNIRSNIETIIFKRKNEEIIEMEVVKLKFNDLDQVYNEMLKKIMRSDPTFIDMVRKCIIEESKNRGIDPDNYCFDISAKNELLSSDKEIMNSIDVNNICDTINPELLKRTMVLPNGRFITARTYIEQIVYPMIPASGYFILTNGHRMSYKQYIEEIVLFEGQIKYSGDFGKLLLATTRYNDGYVKNLKKN